VPGQLEVRGLTKRFSPQVTVGPLSFEVMEGEFFSLQAEGLPVDIVYPRGSSQVGNGFPILKGTKFERQAQQFVNITLDPEYQLEMTRRFRYPPSSRKAKLPADIAHYGLKDDDLKNMMPLDFHKINQHRAAYLARWNKEVLG